jgi:hypothetical protein
MSMYSMVKWCLIDYLDICSFEKRLEKENLCKPENLYSSVSLRLH